MSVWPKKVVSPRIGWQFVRVHDREHAQRPERPQFDSPGCRPEERCPNGIPEPCKVDLLLTPSMFRIHRKFSRLVFGYPRRMSPLQGLFPSYTLTWAYARGLAPAQAITSRPFRPQFQIPLMVYFVSSGFFGVSDRRLFWGLFNTGKRVPVTFWDQRFSAGQA